MGKPRAAKWTGRTLKENVSPRLGSEHSSNNDPEPDCKQGYPRWVDMGDLNHHCAICSTVLASAKARGTCIEKHEFPCPMFHGSLMREDSVNNCKTCRTTEKVKTERERNIARIVHLIVMEDKKTKEGEVSSKAPAKKGRNTIRTDILTDQVPASLVSSVACCLNHQSQDSNKNDKSGRSKTVSPEDDSTLMVIEIPTVSELLEALQVSFEVDGSTKQRRKLINELKDCVAREHCTVTAEQVETVRRKGAYLHYFPQSMFNG